MTNKIKENKYQILELTIIFIITLIFNLMCNQITTDEVWNYGFSYNIANGLIPYKDFNMVITPLYPIINAIILTLFGKNIIIFHIFNAFICTMIFNYMKKHCHRTYYIPYSIFLIYALPNYNILCILLLYILINLEKKKSNDYLIGLILGLTFLTKQNIGIFLCIPTLFTKDIKKILKRIAGFIIPNIFLLIYLIYNNILYQFIDYTFLGMKDFINENHSINIFYAIVFIISIIYLIYNYLKKKDIVILYLLSFHLIAFPLLEAYHAMIALIPTITYLMSNIKLNKKISIIFFIIFILNLFSINTYMIYKNKYSFPNNTQEFKYRKIEYNEANAASNIANYLNTLEDDIYIISLNAYLLKLESNIKINNYDLLVNGNIGLNGEKRIINDIKNNCQNNKCIFLVDTHELKEQEGILCNKDILNYITNHYNQIGILGNYNIMIYKNY